MIGNALLVLVALATGAYGYVVLQEKAYVQLNDINGQKTINASTYNRVAFDDTFNILYNTAKEPGRLSVFTLAPDGRPTLLTEVAFDVQLTGLPLDVEFCKPTAAGGLPRLAISFEDPNSASADGTVRIYEPLSNLQTQLNLLKSIAEMEKVKQARERRWAPPTQCWPKRSEVSNASLPYDQKKNNAIARLNLETSQVSTVFPLGNRSWIDYYMDPSDLDGQVNMRGYNVYSLFQATEMAWVVKGNRNWLLTLDTGFMNTIPEYSYTDFDRAKTMMSNGAISTTDMELDIELRDDTELGRLMVSKEDGRGGDGTVSDVFTFGGRGFSIHNANTFSTPSAIVDSIEQATQIARMAPTNNSSRPSTQINALHFMLCFVKERKRYLQNNNLSPVVVVASSTSNSISVYTVAEDLFGAVAK